MADLSSFATKDKAEEGKWFPVKIDGVKYPMALKLYGDDSDVVQDFDRARVRKLGIGKTKNEIDEDTIDELIDSQIESYIIRVADVSSYDWKKKCNTNEDLTIGDVVITKAHDSVAFLVEKIPALKGFITEKSKRSNFLS